MKRKNVVILIALLWVFLFFVGEPALKANQVIKKVEDDKTRIAVQEPVGTHTVLADLGVDLVVSKVKVTRGVFAGQHKIQIIPYIKNMCNGITRTRIKVWLPDIAAEWIEGGIGPKEEKSAGALYLMDNEAHNAPVGPFSVVVDNNNTIEENNESNNTCGGITLGAAQTTKTHSCPPVGPHCRQPPNLKKYQMKDQEIRR
jgi:hypothetical protein